MLVNIGYRANSASTYYKLAKTLKPIFGQQGIIFDYYIIAMTFFSLCVICQDKFFLIIPSILVIASIFTSSVLHIAAICCQEKPDNNGT